MKSVPENIKLSKGLFHRFPWSTECLTLPPKFLSVGVEGEQLQSTGFSLRRGRWQMPLLLFSQWKMLLASANL